MEIRRRLTPSAAAGPVLVTRLFLVHLDLFSHELLAIEGGDRSARLVTFHLDKSEAATLAAENVGRQADGAHFAVLGEKGLNIRFAGIRGEIADIHLEHVIPRIGMTSGTASGSARDRATRRMPFGAPKLRKRWQSERWNSAAARGLRGRGAGEAVISRFSR